MPSAVPTAIAPMNVAGMRQTLAPPSCTLTTPTLIIASRTDRLFPMGRQLVERRPGWDYAELPGGAGMVFERAPEWAAPILSFLAAHHPAAASVQETVVQ